MSFNIYYKYYDTPEGKDILLKTFALSKIAGASGLIWSTYDVLLYSHPKGFYNTAARYIYYTGPLLGMAAAFTVTTNVAQNIRGKNDKLNYFLGGAAAGSIVGTFYKSAVVGVPAAVILGLAAIVKKISIDEGWLFFPEVTHSANSITSHRRDWTFKKDLPPNWTTGK